MNDRGGPAERGKAAVPAHLHDKMALLERLVYCAEFQQVEEAAAIVHSYQEQKYPLASLKETLGKALLREDATFHMASEGVLYLIDTHLLQYAFEMYQAEAHACFDRAEGYLASFGNF